MSTRVALIGAAGKMGRFTQGLIRGEADLELCATLGREDDLAAALREQRPDVALDFTVAGLGAEHARVALECGVRPLVGTSGVSAEVNAALDEQALALGLGGLVVPNFCMGVWLQQRLALEAAPFFPKVEIVEEHHHTKVDAPSGTAADTAQRLAQRRGEDLDQIAVHSLRLPGLYSNQSVVFGSPGEVLRIEHETYGLEAFGPGILVGLLARP